MDKKLAWPTTRLDVARFAQDSGRLAWQLPLVELPRLQAELAEPPLTHTGDEGLAVVASGELRPVLGASAQVWLRVQASAQLWLTCQRCLEPMAHQVSLNLAYRFVSDERAAEREDESSEEDVLVLSKSLNLVELVEDELLMALPLVPRHAECPSPPPVAFGEVEGERNPGMADGSPRRPNPFAALAGLKKTS